MSVTAFTPAAAPLTLMPKTFVEGLEKRYSSYDRAMTRFENAMENIQRMHDALDGRAPDTHIVQRRLSVYCTSLLHAGRDRAMFLTYCYKNQAFVVRATKRDGATINLFNDRVHRATGLYAGAFKDHDYLKTELDTLYKDMRHGLSMAYDVMSEETREHRASFATHGDPFMKTLNETGKIYMQDYHNWLEYHFLRKFNLRLGLFPVMADTRILIENKVNSPFFGHKLLKRISTARLQGTFPGLSIDAMPVGDSQLRLARQRIAPYAAFTPNKEANVIKITPSAP